VAERKAREEAEVARREAEEAVRVKDEFLATVSHELLTPLTSILGWARLLSTGRLHPDEVTRAIAIIERNGLTQKRLVDDLLDIARITTGKMRLRIETVDLSSTIRQAIDTVSLAANAKNIRLTLSLAEKVPVFGDSERLMQVVWNILSNAVKFTPSYGTIHVQLTSMSGQAHISVRDSGVGISTQFLPHVFERFRQGDMSTTRNYKGLGVGLAIVRYLIELHGGTVTASSEGQDRGSEFIVTLPLMKTPDPSLFSHTLLENSLERNIRLDGVNVLVVEDDSDTRALMVNLLELQGAKIVAADTVATAIESMEQSRPDILVADLSMPGEDGFALIKKLRQRNDTLKTVPAIAVTALVQAEDQKHALAAGYQYHIPKPIESSALLNAIHSAITKKINS
jgi:CheY-like chemotaxis protein